MVNFNEPSPRDGKVIKLHTLSKIINITCFILNSLERMFLFVQSFYSRMKKIKDNKGYSAVTLKYNLI
jgi:hypothetical protein